MENYSCLLFFAIVKLAHFRLWPKLKIWEEQKWGAGLGECSDGRLHGNSVGFWSTHETDWCIVSVYVCASRCIVGANPLARAAYWCHRRCRLLTWGERNSCGIHPNAESFFYRRVSSAGTTRNRWTEPLFRDKNPRLTFSNSTGTSTNVDCRPGIQCHGPP